jgi:NAD(P)H-dependent flavin oxidoreductase YrpB (nitropropane dioxygenase family)
MENWDIPLIDLNGLEVKLIQGGMGVGISGASLASAVAEEGGAGIIAAVGLGALKNYPGDYVSANKAALRDEIRSARAKSNGVIGVNIMHVLSDYSEMVKVALEERVDIIISGAGIPRDLPSYLNENSKTKLIPIVSSARLAGMLCKAWGRLNHLPDAIIVEGPKAGGHLGYSLGELANPDFVENALERIVPEVIKEVKPYETERRIPIIPAGGIFYGGDAKKLLGLGASGVQIATRLVTTPECDANLNFKKEYLKSEKNNIVIIKSPVGMPGRAIKNQFLLDVESGKRVPIRCPYRCLKTCIPKESPYCIARALIEAQGGNFENGYAFCGANAHLTKEEGIISVKEVFRRFNEEYLKGKISD